MPKQLGLSEYRRGCQLQQNKVDYYRYVPILIKFENNKKVNTKIKNRIIVIVGIVESPSSIFCCVTFMLSLKLIYTVIVEGFNFHNLAI